MQRYRVVSEFKVDPEIRNDPQVVTLTERQFQRLLDAVSRGEDNLLSQYVRPRVYLVDTEDGGPDE